MLWIREFLKDRSQSVSVRGTLSKSCSVLSGVPQGCVLSPILFALYINDLYALPLSSKVLSYADDTKIINLTKYYSLLQKDLDLISIWCTENYMIINTQKTVRMHFGKSKSPVPYTINGISIREVSSYKDLGVVIDHRLRFSEHCYSLIKKCSWISRAILTLFKHRSPIEYFKLFKIYVRPILEYNAYFCFPYLKKDIALVESVQRKFTKRICDKSLSYEQRLSQLGECSVYSRYLLISLQSTYKILNKSLCISFSYKSSVNSMTRQGSHSIFVPFLRNSYRKNFCIFRCVRVWNSLSDSLKNAESYPSFRRALVKHLPELRA